MELNWELCNSCKQKGIMPIMPGSIASARRCQLCGYIQTCAAGAPAPVKPETDGKENR